MERVRDRSLVSASSLTLVMATQVLSITSATQHVGFEAYSSTLRAWNQVTDFLRKIAAALLRYARLRALEALGIPADILDRLPHT